MGKHEMFDTLIGIVKDASADEEMVDREYFPDDQFEILGLDSQTTIEIIVKLDLEGVIRPGSSIDFQFVKKAIVAMKGTISGFVDLLAENQ